MKKNRKKIILLTAVKESGKTTVFNLITKNAKHFGIKESEVAEMMLAKRLKEVCSCVMNLPRELMDDARNIEAGDVIPREYREILDGSGFPMSAKIPVREVPFKNELILNHRHLQLIVSQFGFEEIPQYTIKHIGKKILNARQLLQYVGTEVLREYDENAHCNFALKEMKKNKTAKLFIVTDCRFHNEFDCFENEAYTTSIIRDDKIKSSKERIERNEEHRSEIYVPAIIEKCEFKIDNNGDLVHLEKNVVEYLKKIKGN